MSITLNVQRSSIIDEFTAEQQKKHFSLVENKVIHNIDTFYYSVSLNEADEKYNINNFVSALTEGKEMLIGDRNKEILFCDFTLTLRRYSIYTLCLSVDNMYDIFVSHFIPNSKTPRIVVQLRSIGLWIDGTEKLIQASYDHLVKLLGGYSVTISRVQENRIDYCYHTNSIQNPYKYFGDQKLLKNLETSMRKYQKVGDIGRKITIDYFSLGMRKGNNVFFRAYHKTKEVIELQYKSFFIEYWHQCKLISSFDKYCLEHAYKKGSYNALIEGRCLWYLEHGADQKLQAEIKQLLKTCVHNSDNLEYLENAIAGIIPEVTIIVNVEYETKRKFYYSFDASIKEWESALEPSDKLHRLFSIVQNRKTILDYLTSKTVFFKGAWWKRIQSCKIKHQYDSTLIRSYMTNLDRKRVKRNMLKSVATLSIYDNKRTNTYDLHTDFESLIASLNDNDMHEHSRPIFIDGETGEQLELRDEDYAIVKHKKNKQLKSII